MIGAGLQFLAEPVQRERSFLETLLDQTAGTADHVDLRRRMARIFWTAAAAGPETGALGGVGNLEEYDILAARAASGAARPAIHTCRAHSVYKSLIAAHLTRQDDLPTRLVDHYLRTGHHGSRIRWQAEAKLSDSCGQFIFRWRRMQRSLFTRESRREARSGK